MIDSPSGTLQVTNAKLRGVKDRGHQQTAGRACLCPVQGQGESGSTAAQEESPDRVVAGTLWKGVRLRAQLGQYLLNSVSEVLMRKERAPRGPVWSHGDLSIA